jgi:hypothetical protein
MRKLTPRESILLGVVGLAGVVYLWYVSERALSSRSAELMNVEGGNLLADTAPVVPMYLLAHSGDSYDRKGRDLFQYSKRPPTAEELEAERRRREAQQRAAQEAAEQRRAAAEAAAEEARNRPPPPPPTPAEKQPPRIPFQYIGYLGPKDNRIAVFQEGEELLLARRGEPLQDLFRVVDIRYESVVMGFTDPEFKSRTRELPMKGK